MKVCSKKATQMHRRMVRKFILKIVWLLIKRAFTHDKSKLSKEEKPGFDKYTPMLAKMTYGSEIYKQHLAALGETLKIHYSRNRHHPEFYSQGIKEMDLVDIVEMFCDWFAATKRHDDGNIYASILKNKERFDYGDDIAFILNNTAYRIFGFQKKHQK